MRDVSLFLYPGGEMAYAEFTQDYASDRLSSTARKQLYWKRQGDDWHIVLERSQDAPTRYATR